MFYSIVILEQVLQLAAAVFLQEFEIVFVSRVELFLLEKGFLLLRFVKIRLCCDELGIRYRGLTDLKLL